MSNERKYDYESYPEQENVVTQVLIDGKWVDYARSTLAQAKRHLEINGKGKYRMVDWIWKDVIEP